MHEKISIKLNDKLNITSPYFEIMNLLQTLPSELTIGEENIFIRTIDKAYSTVFILEPFMIIKNCLPTCFHAQISSNITHDKANFDGIIETQQEKMLNMFHSQQKIFIKLDIAGILTSSKYQIYPLEDTEETKNNNDNDKDRKNNSQQDNDIEKTIDLYQADKTLGITLFVPKISISTKKIILYSKACIINETSENLFFYSNDHIMKSEKRLKHEIKTIEGNYILLMDDIKNIKIKSNKEDSQLSDEIKIEKNGQFSVDVPDHGDNMSNFGVNISSIICGI